MNVYAILPGDLSLVTWFLLLGVFIVDATITLLRRMLRGEEWYVPHRSHAYQRIVRAGHSHARVSTAIALVNCILGAVAFSTLFFPVLTLTFGLAALAGLLGLYALVEKIQPM